MVSEEGIRASPPLSPTAALPATLAPHESGGLAKVSLNLTETGEVRLDISLDVPANRRGEEGDKQLPAGEGGEGEGAEDELSVEIVSIPHNGRTVHLVGTAHVSKQSCDDVKIIMERKRPQVVAVELCKRREAMLRELPPQDLSLSGVLEQISKPNANVFEVLYGWYLASVASSLEVAPGSEFRVAYNAARRQEPKARVVLVDRPVNVTVARMWGGLTPWEKVRIAWTLVYDTFFNIRADEMEGMLESMKGAKGADNLAEAVAEFAENFPGLLPPLMSEREAYMASQLMAQTEIMAEGEEMVAIVGAGHVKGIRERWGEKADLKALLETPPPTPFPLHLKALLVIGGVGGVALVAAAGGAVIFGAWRGALFAGGRLMRR